MVMVAQSGNDRRYYTLTPDDSSETLLDLDALEIERLYKRHGALLFRGFPFDVDIFRLLTQKFCTHSVFNNSTNRSVVDKGNHIQSVNRGPGGITLHPEMAREPYKPDVCWFACISPARTGGETFICDGVELAKNMTPDVFRALESRRLLYNRKATQQDISFWLETDQPSDEELANPPAGCPYEFWRNGNQIDCCFSAPALHKPMFANDLAFGNFLLLARQSLKLKSYPVFEDGSIIPDGLVADLIKTADNIKEPVAWQANDVLMLDNTRFMHGRNKIEDPDNRNIVTYFGFLRFASPGLDEMPNARWRDVDGLIGLFD